MSKVLLQGRSNGNGLVLNNQSYKSQIGFNMSMTNLNGNTNLNLKLLIKDKIFQYYFKKRFMSTDYEDFFTYKDQVKINFLVEILLLVVSTGEPCEDKQSCNNPSLASLNKINTKSTLFKVQSQQVFSQSHLNNQIALYNEDELLEAKSNLKRILEKYQRPPEIKISTDIMTGDLETILSGIEQRVLNEASQESEVKEEIEKINHTQDLTANEEKIEDNDYSSGVYEKLNEAQIISSSFPIYNATYYKIDYNKTKREKIDINMQIKNQYIQDNKEVSIRSQWKLGSNQNKIKVDDFICYNQDQTNPQIVVKPYKILMNPHQNPKKSSWEFILFNKLKECNIFFNRINNRTIRSLRSITSNKQIHTRSCIIKDLVIVNEVITDNLNLVSKKKIFFGDDLIDKIYFCPPNDVIVLDYNETNKLGKILIDYIHLEENTNIKKSEIEDFIQILKQKYESEVKKIEEEKEDLVNQLNYITEEFHNKVNSVEKFKSSLKSIADPDRYAEEDVEEYSSCKNLEND